MVSFNDLSYEQLKQIGNAYNLISNESNIGRNKLLKLLNKNLFIDSKNKGQIKYKSIGGAEKKNRNIGDDPNIYMGYDLRKFTDKDYKIDPDELQYKNDPKFILRKKRQIVDRIHYAEESKKIAEEFERYVKAVEKRQEEEAKKKQEEEAKKKQEEEAKKKQEEEAKKKKQKVVVVDKKKEKADLKKEKEDLKRVKAEQKEYEKKEKERLIKIAKEQKLREKQEAIEEKKRIKQEEEELKRKLEEEKERAHRSKNLYCMAGPVPKGKYRGDEDECALRGEIGYWGENLVDPDMLDVHNTTIDEKLSSKNKPKKGIKKNVDIDKLKLEWSKYLGRTERLKREIAHKKAIGDKKGLDKLDDDLFDADLSRILIEHQLIQHAKNKKK